MAILMGLSWQNPTELLACNLSFSNNYLLVMQMLRNTLIIASCLGRPDASIRKEKCLAYKGNWQCSSDIIGKETWLSWQCAVLERHDCWAQARVALGRLMQCVWMKATSDFTQKQMSTTQLSLLLCMPEKTGQFIVVMAGALVSSSSNTSEFWLVQKGMRRLPQLRSQSIAKSSFVLQVQSHLWRPTLTR